MSGVFGGGSASTTRKNELAAFGDLSNAMYFGQYSGQPMVSGAAGGLGTAQTFAQSLMSGQPGAMLAPQISTIQQQAGQQRATGAQFGTRSGGTAAANQAIGTNVNTEIDNLIGQLTGTGLSADITASQALGQLGTTVTGQGVQAASNLANVTAQEYANIKAQQNQNISGALQMAALVALA
jgi:hypothetical protein